MPHSPCSSQNDLFINLHLILSPPVYNPLMVPHFNQDKIQTIHTACQILRVWDPALPLQPISSHVYLILASAAMRVSNPVLLLLSLPRPLCLSIFNLPSSFGSHLKCYFVREAFSGLSNLFGCSIFSWNQYHSFLALTSILLHKQEFD